MVALPFLPASATLVLAPAGSGKTTVTVAMAHSRLQKGQTCWMVAQYRATGVAFRKVCAATGVPTAAIPVFTFNTFARLVNQGCHLDVPSAPEGLDRAEALVTAWREARVPALLSRLVNVFSDAWAASKVDRLAPRASPDGGIGRYEGAISSMVDSATAFGGPPDWLTWQGMYNRWRAGGMPSGLVWDRYADEVLAPLALHGCRAAVAEHTKEGGLGVLQATRRQKADAGPPKVTVYEFVTGWCAAACVRLRLYDTFYNVHRLELAWFPERFDMGQAALAGTAPQVLLVDEAQDMPFVDAVYMPALHSAWGAEVWYIGDPHQQIYDFRGSTNMLARTDAADRVVTMTANFRNPQQVVDALLERVEDLPPIHVCNPAPGQVVFQAVPPTFEAMQDALVMFRGNFGLVRAAGHYFAHMHCAAAVTSACLARIQGAWRKWRDDGFPDKLPRAAAAMVDASLDDDSRNAFVQAFSSAKGALRATLQQAPDTWLCGRDEDVPVNSGAPPLFSTVHSCKGQGHPKVILMEGIVPHVDDYWSIQEPEGKLVYTAITRASKYLCVVTQLADDAPPLGTR